MAITSDRHGRRGPLGVRRESCTERTPGSSPRQYLSAEQLAEITPWSTSAIEKMVRRGTMKRGVHYFQPFGRRTQILFKWSAIVELIEGTTTTSPAPISLPSGPLDVAQAEAALGRLLDR